MVEITCAGRAHPRNQRRDPPRHQAGEREIVVKNPSARHNLAVAMLDPYAFALRAAWVTTAAA